MTTTCAIPPPAATCLYHQVLGDAWDALPDSIRDAHWRPTVHATGRFRITAAPGPLARILRRACRLPAPAEDCPLTLTVERRANEERWTRAFGNSRIATIQSRGHCGLLLERYRCFLLSFQLSADEAALTFSQRRAWLRLGPVHIPLPPALAPRISARESTLDTHRNRVEVSVSLPLIGELLHYQGWYSLAEPPP